MNKKTIILFTIIVCLVPMLILFYATGRPGYGDTHDSCHNSTGYTIGTTSTGVIQSEVSSVITFNISATGTNLFVQAIPGAKDNDAFTITPTTDRINETSIYDLDPNPDSILVSFNVTTPDVIKVYTMFIIAGNDAHGQINFAYIEIVINVGGAALPGFDWSIIFDHLGLYLGMPALILVSLATVLVLLNESKFVRLHGILAGGSWILTVVNVVAALIKIPPIAWLGGYDLLIHIPHIILGAAGIVTGFLSMLFGIAAERKPAKITGYITLVCWWSAFLLGYFLNSNLLLI
ncbi:MAG: hypothetical protein ACFFEY_02725 [Candidatus Thorarchaeota archaeon]